MIPINEETVKEAVLGGALLGGGGGGDLRDGEFLGKLALAAGNPILLELDELADAASLVTVSAVGAPAAREQFLKPVHYVKAVELLQTRGVKVDGLITCENGGLATVNGWFQSAVLGIPVVDAPANGRAHPIGLMGSMGLHKVQNYTSLQTAAGGNKEAGRYVEAIVAAGLTEAAKLIRQASISAGGLVGVARNPITVGYARKHGAVGAISQAIELGRIMRQGKDKPSAIIEKAAGFLKGRIITEGEVKNVHLETVGGFDVGTVTVANEEKLYELTFWNEYMTIENEGERIGTFPDLLATFDMKMGLPLPTAAVRKGQRVAVIHVPREHLKLGSGMKDPELYRLVEEVIKKPVVNYGFKSS